MDYGFHPPTIYFPLVVPEALMIEPTETESQVAVGRVLRAMLAIAEEAASDPTSSAAPAHAAGRPSDEVKAAKRAVVRYGFDEHPALADQPSAVAAVPKRV
jgi:glycine dehydrogenase subunit 2